MDKAKPEGEHRVKESKQEELRKLRLERGQLLEEIHKEQKKLDSIDYQIAELRKDGKVQ